MIRTGPDSMQVAVVQNNEFNAGIGLPAGASVTQSILSGDCRNVNDSLGYFKGITGASGPGSRTNQGLSGPPWDLSAHRTQCDSISLTTGTSMQVVGISGSLTTLISPVVEIHGSQLHEMLHMMDAAASDAGARRFEAALPGSQVHQMMGPTRYHAQDYTHESCDDSLGSQMARSLLVPENH
jgi:hypothetical protein